MSFRVTPGGTSITTSPPQKLLKGVIAKKQMMMKKKVKKKLKVQPPNPSLTLSHFSYSSKCRYFIFNPP